jgi:hypothetical protein
MTKASSGSCCRHSTSLLTILGTSVAPKLRPEEEKSSIKTVGSGKGGEAPFARREISPATSQDAPDSRKTRRVDVPARPLASMMLTSLMATFM